MLPKIYDKSAHFWVFGKGKITILQKYVPLILYINNVILSIKVAALPIKGLMARNLILVFIWIKSLQLLREMADVAESSQASIFSMTTVRSFLYQKLNYSI